MNSDVQARLDAIRKKHAAATKGVWKVFRRREKDNAERWNIGMQMEPSNEPFWDKDLSTLTVADAYAIVEAHNTDIPFLLDELEAARTLNRQILAIALPALQHYALSNRYTGMSKDGNAQTAKEALAQIKALGVVEGERLTHNEPLRSPTSD